MVSLSVLFGSPVAGAQAAAALAASGLPAAFDPVEQEGMSGELSWLEVDGVRVGVLVAGAPFPVAELRDAVAHSRWQHAEEAVRKHVAHARLFAPDAAGLPALTALSRAAAPLLTVEGATALVGDAGRALNDAALAQKKLADLARVPPVDLWVSVRHFHLADATGWFLDTLGMAQLDLPDLEAYAGSFRTDSVAGWLRNLTLYLVQQGAPIQSGDTLDGPDETPWVAREDGATVEPPRRVVRFAPLPQSPAPEAGE